MINFQSEQISSDFVVQIMRQKIKIALCVRLTVLLMGTVLYYLLTNAFINNDDNKFDAPTSDGE